MKKPRRQDRRGSAKIPYHQRLMPIKITGSTADVTLDRVFVGRAHDFDPPLASDQTFASKRSFSLEGSMSFGGVIRMPLNVSNEQFIDAFRQAIDRDRRHRRALKRKRRRGIQRRGQRNG